MCNCTVISAFYGERVACHIWDSGRTFTSNPVWDQYGYTSTYTKIDFIYQSGDTVQAQVQILNDGKEGILGGTLCTATVTIFDLASRTELYIHNADGSLNTGIFWLANAVTSSRTFVSHQNNQTATARSFLGSRTSQMSDAVTRRAVSHLLACLGRHACDPRLGPGVWQLAAIWLRRLELDAGEQNPTDPAARQVAGMALGLLRSPDAARLPDPLFSALVLCAGGARAWLDAALLRASLAEALMARPPPQSWARAGLAVHGAAAALEGGGYATPAGAWLLATLLAWVEGCPTPASLAPAVVGMVGRAVADTGGALLAGTAALASTSRSRNEPLFMAAVFLLASVWEGPGSTPVVAGGSQGAPGPSAPSAGATVPDPRLAARALHCLALLQHTAMALAPYAALVRACVESAAGDVCGADEFLRRLPTDPGVLGSAGLAEMVVTLVEHLGAGSPAGPLMLEAVATESAALLADERTRNAGLELYRTLTLSLLVCAHPSFEFGLRKSREVLRSLSVTTREEGLAILREAAGACEDSTRRIRLVRTCQEAARDLHGALPKTSAL
ncbi:hypothetical protein F751_2133 [Auxenochlorella protothecoides]|uniref:Uncharacterized protein n=1 Tax=Auxenochlorella protothecoides TaxID=3075 RepID=A0A087SLE2_AUXPR|nr:hypothetical protein F751_2133 [Auxenochlorella protothecoides]KFM26546.1 hypothetical protein F751_2133 [Auxenochlorella protothecoides]